MELEEQRPEGWRPSDVPWPPKNLPGLESGGSLERGLLDDLWGLEQRRAQSASNGQAHPAPAGQMANAPSLPQSWPSDHLSTSDGASEGQDHDIESSTGPVGHLSEELLGNVPLLGRKSRKTTWLWPGYLAAGKVTIFDGDPGVGKSTLSLFIASRLSTSSPLLDGFRPEKATTLILNADDDIDDTSLARLEADEADLSRLSMQASVPTEDGKTSPLSTSGRYRIPEESRTDTWGRADDC